MNKLTLHNFRSHRDRELKLDPLTLVIGPNGAGKTNILEALWMLSTTRSFRTQRDWETITWGETDAHVSGDEWEFFLVKEPFPQKYLKIKGVIYRPIEYLGNFITVLFTPESLRIITGEPSDRRRFIDVILAQNSREMAFVLNRYRRVITQRNVVLKNVALRGTSINELEPWNFELATYGSQIVAARKELINRLDQLANNYYHQVSQSDQMEFRLEYVTNAATEQGHFLSLVEKNQKKDLDNCLSNVGPHRDDIVFKLNNRPIASFASRGEIRSGLLSLKWAEYEFLCNRGQVQPFLLFDDPFFELDYKHRLALEDFFAAGQSLCTTTEIGNLSKTLIDNANIVELG